MYHYSKACHFKEIMDSGVIKRAMAGVPKSEKPAVWLTLNDEWEGTALKLDCMEPRHRNIFLPIRFKLKDELIDNGQVKFVSFEEHKKSGGMDLVYAKALSDSALEMGSNSDDWFCCYDDIPIDNFNEPEVWDGSAWVSIDHMNGILAESRKFVSDVKRLDRAKQNAIAAQKKAKRKAAHKAKAKNRKK